MFLELFKLMILKPGLHCSLFVPHASESVRKKLMISTWDDYEFSALFTGYISIRYTSLVLFHTFDASL